MKTRYYKTKISSRCFVAFLFLILVGCNNPAPHRFQFIQNDPLSTVEPAKGVEVNRMSQGGNEFKLIPKPKLPELFIQFEPLAQGSQDVLFRELRTIALSEKWISNSDMDDLSYFSGSKQKSQDTTLLVEIGKHSDSSLVFLRISAVPSSS